MVFNHQGFSLQSVRAALLAHKRSFSSLKNLNQMNISVGERTLLLPWLEMRSVPWLLRALVWQCLWMRSNSLFLLNLIASWLVFSAITEITLFLPKANTLVRLILFTGFCLPSLGLGSKPTIVPTLSHLLVKLLG